MVDETGVMVGVKCVNFVALGMWMHTSLMHSWRLPSMVSLHDIPRRRSELRPIAWSSAYASRRWAVSARVSQTVERIACEATPGQLKILVVIKIVTIIATDLGSVLTHD